MDELERSRRRGRKFERRFLAGRDVQPVPGSGNQFVSKLDKLGFGVRWSLKATKNRTVPLDAGVIDEAVDACEGPGGSGEIPMWATSMDNNNPKYDLITMRIQDFERFAKAELVLMRETKSESRRRTASIPQILRDDG